MVTGPTMAVIRAGRVAAERLMADRCVVERVVGMIDGDDGYEVPKKVVVYHGKCKVQTYEAWETTPEAGEHTYSQQRYRIDFPVSAGPVLTGDIVTVDRYLYPFRASGEFNKTHETAQRVLADQITR